MRNPEGPRSIMLSDRAPIESSIKSEDIFYTELSKQSPDYYELITFLINLGQGQDRVNFIAKMVKNNQSAMNNVFEFLSWRTIHNIDNAKKNLIDDFLNPNTGFKKPIRKVSSLSVRSSVEKIESEEKFIEELGRDSPNYTNLNFFLISLEPGQVRVNFIAIMVEKNQFAMDNVFRNLVSNGVSDKSYGHLVKILIDDFINPASNFNIVKDCKGVNHIFNATHHGKPELVKYILERDPDSVNIISIRGGSLIHVAVSNRMAEVLNELLNCSNLNLYALRTRKDKDKVTTIVESVFDIAKKLGKYNRIPGMLLGEHKRRFDSRDPAAIAFENTFKILLQSANPKYRLNPSATIENSTMSVEGHNGNLQQAIIENREGSSAHLGPSGSPIIPAVVLDAIAFEISRASDKTINADAEMASSIINPHAPQASFQLSDETVMVWEGNNYSSDCISQLLDQQKITLQDKQKIDEIIATSLVEILNNIQTQTPGGGAMIGDIRGLSSDFSLAPLNTPLTEASTQITDSINENHEVKDPQPISSSVGPDTSSQRAFRPFKRTKTSSVVASISSLEAVQSIDDGERITSRISPTSQESLSGSDKGKRWL